MTQATNSTDPTEAVVARVRKLLAMASHKTSNEAEAASALSKAQALLAAHNLDMATVEQGGGSGKREDARVRGGFYVYERELWQAVAGLNFCLYFTTTQWVPVKSSSYRRKRQFSHRVVGSQVNARTTVAMAEYLQATIERLCRERLATRHGAGTTLGDLNSQFFSSWAVAFREGVADRVVEKLRDRRRTDVERREAEAKRRAAMAGASTSTALTIADVAQRERDLNVDHVYGEGTSAGWAADRAAQAAAEAAAEAAAVAWAAAHPEEAAREAARERARERRRMGRREAGPDARDRRRWSGAYREGWENGARVGLDPQAQAVERKRIVKS